jgi:tetratricopeptide (TPR) repeat protein
MTPSLSIQAGADVSTQARILQARWSEIFYEKPKTLHSELYKELLVEVKKLEQHYPNSAEPLIVEAIVLCTMSGASIGIDSIGMLEDAKTLLERAIDINPPALEGAAYITLGNLYRRLPGWPILYGNPELARQYFLTALHLYPEAIDSNYFYGDYLLSKGDYAEAAKFLEKAMRAPIRPSLIISDKKVRGEAGEALNAAKNKHPLRSDFFSFFTPSFD